MQISSLSTSSISALYNFSYSSSNGRNTTARSQQTAQTDYSSSQSSILLSLSSNVEYTEATYSLEGIMSNSGKISTASTEETDSSLAIQVENLKASYLEIIKERVEYLLKELTRSMSGSESSATFLNPSDSDTGNISIEQTLAASQSMSAYSIITDPDYFSAENTAQRIVQFALSFYDGGDRAEYVDMVKAAVMKGYEEAGAAWGGALPSIASDTIFLAMKALDQFAAGSEVDYTA